MVKFLIIIFQVIMLLGLVALMRRGLMALWRTGQDGWPLDAEEAAAAVSERRVLMPNTKNSIAEKRIEDELLRHLDRRYYHVFRHVQIPCGRAVVRADYVIVSPYGIFVVDGQYFAGQIYGGVRQPHWTQALPPRRKYRFANPLHQNYKHIRALAAWLGLPDGCFHSLVVFAHRDCRFKTVMPANVCLLDGLVSSIRCFHTPVLAVPQLQAACARLAEEAGRIADVRPQPLEPSLPPPV